MATWTKGMLVRRPPSVVFRAWADPEVTTKFWFTKSSGPMVAGAKLTWQWEMFGASAPVVVREVEPERRIVFDWGTPARTVELKFTPVGDHTFIRITETGFATTGDELIAQVADSASGFALVLAACKALLEHDVVLTVVADHVCGSL
jgi:uncharacterized protein YndB with AHSA1/START domain